MQYIGLFIIGILAYENDWFEQVTFRQGVRWFGFSQLLIFIGFPALFIFGGALEQGIDQFMGGTTWQSLAYALWEQLNGMALIIGLTGIFKGKLNSQDKLAKSMSADAYTVYIIHAPVLVLVTLLLTGLSLSPVLKFLAVAPVALLGIFLVSDLLRRLPFAKKVL